MSGRKRGETGTVSWSRIRTDGGLCSLSNSSLGSGGWAALCTLGIEDYYSVFIPIAVRPLHCNTKSVCALLRRSPRETAEPPQCSLLRPTSLHLLPATESFSYLCFCINNIPLSGTYPLSTHLPKTSGLLHILAIIFLNLL